MLHLTHLSCKQNLLTGIPESMGQLTNLHVLKLDSNRLMSLPNAIGNVLSSALSPFLFRILNIFCSSIA